MLSQNEPRRLFPERVAAALLLCGAVWMLPFGKLHDYGVVPWFLSGAAMMLAGFYLALRFPPGSAAMFWVVAAGARLILLFQAPGDDIYRYWWEGRILLAGWNPYLHAPEAAELGPMRDALWASVQHKSFTAIYPPLAQWIMASLATVPASPIFYKAVFALADLAVAALLAARFGNDKTLLYAWNPLVIYSFAGGGHYDSLFLLVIVLGWFAWTDGAQLRAAGWLGAAVALKWLALPVLAWVGWRFWVGAWTTRRWGRVAMAGLAGGLPFVVSFVVLGLWTGEWTLQLTPPKFSQYARSAEFLPGLAGWFWEQSKYHNHWFAIPLAAGWVWVMLRVRDFARAAEWMFFLTFVFTPMFHAWYFTWMIPFAAVTRNRGTMAMAASVFVYFLLYHHFESPQGVWLLSPWETMLLWLPFVAGFLWSVRGDHGIDREKSS